VTDVHRLDLELEGRRTTMLVGQGLLAQAGDLLAAEGVRGDGVKVHLVVDRGTADAVTIHHAPVLEAAVRGSGVVSTTVLEATERAKAMPGVERVWDDLMAAGVDRRGLLVAIGGGIVCDLAGFAAASWMRGIELVLVPTTLLSMVDASLGGKTGVNRPRPDGTLLKNMVGAFWPARLVIADTDTLATLGDREYRAGLAECLKHGLIEGEETLAALAADLPGVVARDPEVLPRFVARSVGVKAGIVARDFRESGDRALLNLGHTFAHAIESQAGWGLLHGEAVGIGLVAAAAASVRADMADASLVDRVRGLVAGAGLPTRLPGGAAEDSVQVALRAAMQLDKKVDAGRLRLVLLRGPGAVEVSVVADPAVVDAGWSAISPV
jgi:3-dehydroquinate synthase